MKSKCCQEELKVVGGDEGTMFYQCLGCGKGADPMPTHQKQSSKGNEKRIVNLIGQTQIETKTSKGWPNSHPHDCVCKECKTPPPEKRLNNLYHHFSLQIP